MGRDVKPPDNPAALAAIIGGQPPADQPSNAAADVPKAGKKASGESKLPAGRMGDPCKLPRGDGSKCPGKLTDLGGHYPDRAAKVTRTTLVCSKCGQVQGISEVPDPSY